MAKVQVRVQGAAQSYEPLPADTYLMRIRAAEVVESTFKDKSGETQLQLRLTWEVARLSQEQEEAGVDASRWVSQWIGWYYGETKSGPSRLKKLIDGLQVQGFLQEFDSENGAEIDTDWFVGIEQRVLLDIKGTYNQVVGVSAPRKKAAPKPAPAPAKPAPKAAPKPAEDDELFEDGDDGVAPF
jgi:hypothetical protein